VLIDGHCDQIGFTVKHIDVDGFIYVDTLGGIDAGVLLGQRVSIHSKDGPILGIFGKKAIHLQSKKESGQVPLRLCGSTLARPVATSEVDPISWTALGVE
jgi:endoglucanase